MEENTTVKVVEEETLKVDVKAKVTDVALRVTKRAIWALICIVVLATMDNLGESLRLDRMMDYECMTIFGKDLDTYQLAMFTIWLSVSEIIWNFMSQFKVTGKEA